MISASPANPGPLRLYRDSALPYPRHCSGLPEPPGPARLRRQHLLPAILVASAAAAAARARSTLGVVVPAPETSLNLRVRIGKEQLSGRGEDAEYSVTCGPRARLRSLSPRVRTAAEQLSEAVARKGAALQM